MLICSGEPREDLLEYVRTLCVEFQKYNIGLEVCDDFHVSLTKTVVLRHHWIEGFVASVRKQLEDVKRYSSKKCLEMTVASIFLIMLFQLRTLFE